MRRYRNDLIYIGLCSVLGGVWIYVSAWRLFAWPLIWAGALLAAAVAHAGERAITRRLNRPARPQHRTHARPASPKSRGTT